METMTLHDGTEVVIRPLSPEDKPHFLSGLERFGENMNGRPRDGDLAWFTKVDHHDDEALGAIDPVTGDGLGVARFVRMHSNPDVAEAAVVIVNGLQGRGLGGALLSALADRAREEGVSRFCAWTLADSREMLRLFGRLGRVGVLVRDGDRVEIDVDLDGALRSSTVAR